MKKRIVGRVVILMLAALGVAGVLAGCYGIPKGTMAQTTAGAVTLQAAGAGIVQADAQKVTFRIKCAVCGYETELITVDTPAPGKPYTLDWVCPKCGHAQKIIISAVAK